MLTGLSVDCLAQDWLAGSAEKMSDSLTVAPLPDADASENTPIPSSFDVIPRDVEPLIAAWCDSGVYVIRN